MTADQPVPGQPNTLPTQIESACPCPSKRFPALNSPTPLPPLSPNAPKRELLLWHDDTAELAVDVVYPDYFDNLEAKTSNATSGVIVLRHKTIPIVVWGGDAPLSAVARAASQNCRPFVLDGPHHGAPQGGYVKEMGPALSQIAAGRLHVSVGSSNAYEHPQPRYLKEALRQKMSVTCTQITQKCGWRPGRPALIQISGKLGLPSPYTGCPCRGTTRLSLDADGWHFDKWDQAHREAIAHGVSHPICMTGTSAGCPAS